MDLEISDAEVSAVRRASEFMDGYSTSGNLPMSAIPPLSFDANPIVQYAENELIPIVHATSELFGVAFTQGNILKWTFLQDKSNH